MDISPDEALALLEGYAKRPLDWVSDVYNDELPLWGKQGEIVEAVFKHRNVAVKSCNSAGKSYIAARVAHAFLMTHPQSIVVSTAPTARQVKDILWRYIGGVHNKAKYPLGGHLTQLGLEFGKDWYGVGLSTSEPEKFFGYHADHILVIVDEASGVDEAIYKGVRAITPNENAHTLLIGNPTNPDGTFYKAFTDPRVKTFTISAFDTPNMQANGIYNTEDLIRVFTPPEGVDPIDHNPVFKMPYPALISPTAVYERLQEWGADSPWYQALILGEFPAQAEFSLIPLNLIQASMDADYRKEHGWNVQIGALEYGLDVARFGMDKTVLAPRRGGFVEPLQVWSKMDTVQTAKRVIDAMSTEDWKALVKVDDTGVGCITGNTKVLTTEGWLYPTQLVDGTMIYSRDEDGNVITERVFSITEKQTEILHSGDYEFSWAHLVPYRTRKRNPLMLKPWQQVLENKAVVFESNFNYQAEKLDFTLPSHSITMPHGGTKHIHDEQIISALEFASFLGWYVSEGSFERGNSSIKITQNKNQHYDEIVRLSSLFGKVQIKKNGGGFDVCVFNKPLQDWIKANCYKGGFGFKYKTVPRFIANNSKKVIDAFLESFCDGDGYIHHGERNYVTSSINLSDDLTELIFKIGKKAYSHVKHLKGSTGTIEGRTITRTEDNLVVTEAKSNRGNNYGLTKPKATISKGKVYSLAISGKTKLMFTKVDGAKPIWTHNGGVTDQLRAYLREDISKIYHYRVAPIDFGSGTSQPLKFYNKRAEMYWNLREMFYAHKIALPNDPELANELASIQFKPFKGKDSQVIAIESKDDIKARLGKSPDKADALVLAFADSAGGTWDKPPENAYGIVTPRIPGIMTATGSRY